MIMDTFIVRIYRYGNKSLKEIVGLVEVPGDENRMGFTDLEELWTILTQRGCKGVEKRKGTGDMNDR
jgi:hypothetical protein